MASVLDACWVSLLCFLSCRVCLGSLLPLEAVVASGICLMVASGLYERVVSEIVEWLTMPT